MMQLGPGREHRLTKGRHHPTHQEGGLTHRHLLSEHRPHRDLEAIECARQSDALEADRKIAQALRHLIRSRTQVKSPPHSAEHRRNGIDQRR